jgi:hypothetical protein
VPVNPIRPEEGRRTIARTQALLRRRSSVLAGAIFFTLLPFSFVYGDRGFRFFFLRDAPGASATCLAGAMAFWVWFLAMTRRLRVKGL